MCPSRMTRRQGRTGLPLSCINGCKMQVFRSLQNCLIPSTRPGPGQFHSMILLPVSCACRATRNHDTVAAALKFMNVNAPQSEIRQIASQADRYGDGEVHVPTIVAEINRAAIPSDRMRSNKFAGLGRSNSTSGPIFTSDSDISYVK